MYMGSIKLCMLRSRNKYMWICILP